MSLSLDAEQRIRVAADVRFLVGNGVPADGTSGTGAGVSGPCSFYMDIANHIVYVNVGTKVSPSWDVFGISNIPDGSITTAMLAAQAVSAAKILDGTITTAKYAAGSVDAAAIAANAVTASELADGAVDTAAILDLNVTTGKLADSAVTAIKIADGVITPAKASVTFLAQATGTISAADLVSTAVGKFGHANGYILVAGQGAHSVIELISGVLIYQFGTAAFTAGGNTTINRSAGAGALTGLISAANFAGAAVNKIAYLNPLSTAGINLTENEGLNLVSSAAFTNPGTAVGVIRYVINYRVHATGL